MKSHFMLLPGLVLILAGCAETETESTGTGGTTAVSGAPSSDLGAPAESLGTEQPTPEPGTGASEGSAMALTPENTKIEFIGTHVVDEKPDPNARRGHFGAFQGTASVSDGKLQSVSVDIETESLATGNAMLDNHLKSADFFDVVEHPTASFKSASVEPGDGDTVTIRGELTLLGNSGEVSIPATISTTDGLTLNAEFVIDRTEFGMDYDPSKVEKDVTLMISIGK
ncbi:MAG: YceI family protein [Planctomycetaceae bacterium]